MLEDLVVDSDSSRDLELSSGDTSSIAHLDTIGYLHHLILIDGWSGVLTLIDRDDLSHTDATRFCYIFGLLAGFCDREIASRPIEFCFVIDIVSSTLYPDSGNRAHTREDSIHGVEFSDFDRETMCRNESIDG